VAHEGGRAGNEIGSNSSKQRLAEYLADKLFAWILLIVEKIIDSLSRVPERTYQNMLNIGMYIRLYRPLIPSTYIDAWYIYSWLLSEYTLVLKFPPYLQIALPWINICHQLSRRFRMVHVYSFHELSTSSGFPYYVPTVHKSDWFFSDAYLSFLLVQLIGMRSKLKLLGMTDETSNSKVRYLGYNCSVIYSL
jgi:hypothetical protein